MRRLLLAACLALTPMAPQAQTLRFAFQGEVQSLDPYAVNETFTTAFLSSVYEPLVRRKPDLSLEPGLAESWERVSDTLWRFRLRPNVRFHGGEPFTADDAVFSLRRIARPGSNLVARVVSVKAARAPDPHTLEIETDGPAPTLLADLTNVLIMPRGWATEHGAEEPVDIRTRRDNFANRNANGTGPFRVVSHEPGQRTVLRRQEAWWDTMPGNVREVVFTPIGSDATRVAALLSGQVDLAWPIPVQDVPRIERSEGLRMIEQRELRTIFLGLDQASPELRNSDVKGKNPLADVRVREALYRAIDIEAIKARVMRGRAAPTALLNGPGIEGFDAALNDARPRHDRARAKQLLAEAGYPDGFGLGLNCPNNRYVNDESICAAVAAMLAQVGVRVTVTAEPFGTFFSKVSRREVSAYLLGTTPPTYDSFSTMFAQLLCREDQLNGRPGLRGGGSTNAGGFCDEEADRAIMAARVELDPAKRRADFSTAWRRMVELYGYIPLHQQYLSWGVRQSVSLEPRPDDVLDLRFVTVR
ncbi:ABC transporter substrate-binding protein [Roseomonas sp. OT10]|uniref:ABC transporter substrate-binding protein n=1 Tax=Roseomonas cutis TaxID=2897332 RepID=UPI001E3EA7EA|nr:ABC transporter substrate-binding protein [Roseomonas sp. OT10]UFN48252.1 ABC transporter substrate-binding protein [Roseomonas sp. OT10]